MAETNLIKNVSTEQSEYIACLRMNGADLLSFEFNSAVTLDDITINISSENEDLDVYFVYPSSQKKGYILKEYTVTNSWFLNNGTNNAGKRWYRLPARTKLVVELISGTNVDVKVSVLGRP